MQSQGFQVDQAHGVFTGVTQQVELLKRAAINATSKAR